MRIWLLAAAALVLLCAVIGFTTLTAPEAEAAGSGSLKVGSQYFSIWEEAVAAAGSSGTIVVTSNFTFPDTATSYQVPAGVTLLVPYSASSTSVNSASADHPYANETLVNKNDKPGKPYEDVSVTMTIPKGVTLYVYGKVVVGGTIGSAANTLWSGGTNGAHANLQVDGTVDLRNSAILAVTGYVVGSGTVEAKFNNAKIYVPMAVEYRGGHHTAGVADSLNAHSGEGKLCPFFQWSLQNIRTDLVLQSGNSLHVYVDLFALSEHNLANARFVGSSGALLNLSSGTTLYASYDDTKVPSSTSNARYTGRNNIRLVGSASVASLTIPTSVMTVETKNYNFPVPYNFHVTVESGTLSVATKTQLLPGSKLEIKQGAALNVASELFVYTGANDFTATASTGSVTLTYPNKNNKTLIYPSTSELQDMGENGAANLIVDGKMTFSSGGKFAGVVQTNGSGEINTTNMTAGTLKRSWGGAGKFEANCETRYMAGETVRSLTPMLYSSGSGTATTMAAGKTYHGTGAEDSHTIRTIQYTLYYSSSGSNKTYTEELNAEVAGSWGDTECTIILAQGGKELARETVYLMNGADISALGYYSDINCASTSLVKKYAGETTLYALYGGTVHTITWKDRNDKVICTTKVMDGALPTYTGPNLDYYVDNGKPYGPTGWNEEIVPATADATYTAKYETVQVKVQDPDGRIWYIHDIGYGLHNFSNTGDIKNGALGIVDGSTVTMLTSFSGRISVLSDNLTLDLNGYTFTASTGPAAILLQKSGIKFTLTNSSTEAGGIVLPKVNRWDMNHAGIYFNCSNSELLVHQVTIDASKDPRGVAVYSGNSGNKLTLDDATLIGNIGGVYMDNAYELNIMGNTQIDAIVPIYCALNNPTIGGTTYAAKLNISGGTFTSTSKTGAETVYFTIGTKDDPVPNGPGLPLNGIAGSALVFDYTGTGALGLSISDGTFIAHRDKEPITFVNNNAIQPPPEDEFDWDGPFYFAKGGYYSKEICSYFYDYNTYSCLLDETVGLYHVYIPTYTITWVYSANGHEEVLRVDKDVPRGTKGTDVRYIPVTGSESQYKDLPTYVGTDKKLYGFTGWTPAVSDVTKDVTYTTKYEAVDAKVESPDGSVRYIMLDSYPISGTKGTYKNVKAGDTVTLLADVTWTRLNIDVPITFDLNGHKFTGSRGYWMAVNVAAGVGNNVTITDSVGTGGISMQASTAEPNGTPYAAVLVVSGNLTLDRVTVSGSTINYTDKTSGKTYTNADGMYNGYPLDSFGVYIKGGRCNLTLTDATVTGHNGGVYLASQSHGLTIQGNTTITAPVPIYCNVEWHHLTGNGKIRIEGGTFESTAGTAPYYKDAAGTLTRLPQSALVIDYGNTLAARPLDVQISGGTFKGYSDAEPISLVVGAPSSDDYKSATHVAPTDFVTGGYFSRVINAEFYDSSTYVCALNDVYKLYCLRYPVITWRDNAGNVLHTQEAQMGEIPVYKGNPDLLQKGNTYVTSWTPEIGEVKGDVSYTANFTAAEARVIAPDGSVSYYKLISNNNKSTTDTIDPTAVFSVNSKSQTVKNPAVPDGSTVQMLNHRWGITRITGKVTFDLNGYNIWANNNPYALYVGGDSENPSEIKIINSAATGGEITTKAVNSTDTNGNVGVVVVKGYTTATLEGLKITTRMGSSTSTGFAENGIGVQSSGAASSVTIKDTTITAGSVGVYVSTYASWTGGEFQGLTIEGNTSISAATPVYFMGKSLNITGGIFTSTGADGTTHSQAYYQTKGKLNGYLNAEGAQALPLSALVIDKSVSPTVTISGGTFKGNGDVDPISIVYIGTETITDPTKFVTGGYFSQAIAKSFYDSTTYVCEQDASHDNLYCLRYPVITWLDNDGKTVLHTQEARMGEIPVYKGPEEKLVKDGLYVTSWKNLPETVSGSVSCTAVYSEAQAKVIAPDGSVSYYKTLCHTNPSESFNMSDVVFYTNSSYTTVKNPAVPDGSTVQMLQSSKGPVRITGKITFDLNGFSILTNNQYAVIAGDNTNQSDIKIINSRALDDTSGVINAYGWRLNSDGTELNPNGNEGVIVVRGYTTVSLEGLNIKTANTKGELIKQGIGILSYGAASSVTLKNTTITAGSVGVYVPTITTWTGGEFQSLTIEGANTSISAATPVYFMGKNLSITGGTFTSTGENATHSLAYYNKRGSSYAYSNTVSGGTLLPLSALVIDKSVSPTVSISGGTFKGYDSTAPISIVWVGTGTAPTAPTDFVTGGYYSQRISADYYDESTYSCVTADNNLYMISAGSVEVTFDLNGHGTTFYKGANDGATIAKPTDPTHPGFTFGGWYKEAACTTEWNFSSDKVTNGTTLYAKWTQNSDAVMGTSGDLKSGNTLTLMERNTVKNNNHLYVAFDVGSLGSGSVRFGHGKTEYGSEYVDLTATTLTVKKYANEETLVGTYTHGLTLSGRVEIQIDVGVGFATITLRCGGKEFRQTDVLWIGCNGDIYVTPTGVNLTIADAHWSCDDYDNTIWFFGDSWFSYEAARWPYYFYQDGYTGYLFSGYPGMNSEAGLASFRQALDYGTPKYAVWCMGMNDADDGAINSSWRTYTDEFLTLCEDRKITPILTTIPSGGRDNSYKNEWIRTNSKVGDVVKFAYVDVERAVISDRSNNTWYDGFADTGMIHPTVEGAKQIYIEIVEKLLSMKALTPSGSGTILKATPKNVSDIWHGNTAYWINAGTGKFYSNAGGTTEITRDSAIVHGGEWTGTEATCTEKGEKTRTCHVCGKKETQIIDALGHAYVAGTPVASTCIEVGYTTYTCSRCKDSYKDFVPLAGHTLGADGVCTVCHLKPDAPGISYVSVTMANSLDMNFAFELPENTDTNGCYVKFTSTTRGGKDQKVERSGWKTTTINEKQYFYATYTGLAAKEMTDMVYAAVYDSTGKLLCPVRGDCIRDQAMRNLAQTSNELAKKMDVAMLNYGAAAQTMFGYRTDDLANNQLSDAQQRDFATAYEPGNGAKIDPQNGIVYMANVELESNIRFVIGLQNVDPSMTAHIAFTDHYGKEKNVEVPLSSFSQDMSTKPVTYVYTFDKTVIADARQVITITIKDSEGNALATFTDSIANYAVRAGEITSYKPLYEAIVKFADAAYAFLHA